MTGYARNLDDGSVQVVACGTQAQVDTLVAWLKQGGPRSARVERVLVEPQGAVDYAGLAFAIEYPPAAALRAERSDAFYRFRQSGDLGGLFGRPFGNRRYR